MSTNTTPDVVLDPGTLIASGWVVERTIPGPSGMPAALVRDEEGTGHAIAIVLGAEKDDPPLEESQANHWGVVRRVLPDESLGRIVIDELPEGVLLSERLVPGRAPAAGALDDLNGRVRSAHRKGFAHGGLSADLIVIGDQGLAVAGWGVADGSIDARKARDIAAVAALQGRAAALAATAQTYFDERPAAPAPRESAPARPSTELENEPTGVTGTTSTPPANAALRTAIRSDNLPTLRDALAAWEAASGDPADADAVRAKDALQRLERRVADSLDKARALLAQGDTLGVVACCREAIRLGAEDEARPLLEEARRTTRKQLSGSKLPPPRVLVSIAAGVVVVVLLVVAGLLALREAPEDEALRVQAEELAQAQGLRESVRTLIDARESGDRRELTRDLVQDHLGRLAVSERAALLERRDEAVTGGARPREADTVAEDALGALDALVAEGPDAAALSVRLTEALSDIDRARTLYHASISLGAAEAQRAVEALIAQDPVFAPTRAGEGRR